MTLLLSHSAGNPDVHPMLDALQTARMLGRFTPAVDAVRALGAVG